MRIRKASEDGGGTSFADYVWKPVVLIEMKKRGADLCKHYRQAFDYWVRLVPDRQIASAHNLSIRLASFGHCLDNSGMAKTPRLDGAAESPAAGSAEASTSGNGSADGPRLGPNENSTPAPKKN